MHTMTLISGRTGKGGAGRELPVNVKALSIESRGMFGMPDYD